MEAIRLPNGNLLVPRRAEGPRGLIGDGMVEISSDDPDFERWAKDARPISDDELERARAI